MDAKEREFLGRIVRNAWVRWAKTQSNPKPSWLVPYDDLSEPDKEADRQIGEAVASQLGVEGLMRQSAQLMTALARQTAEIDRLRAALAKIQEPRPTSD